MEKKTIGQFIATLRKANGMTQKELAEQLNVSDKAVSRWERDESAPDLSLIPVIAEIFGVTSDEILRGERAVRQETTTTQSSEKGRKQIAMLLDKARNKFQMYCLVALGITGIGFVGAIICNFAFYRASLGFFIGMIFYLIAVVVLGIAYLQCMQSIQIEEADEIQLTNCKNHIIGCNCGTVLGIVVVILLTLPFVTHAYSAYIGLYWAEWLSAGIPYACIGIVLGAVFWWGIVGKKFTVTEEQKAKNKRKLKYVRNTAIILVLSLIAETVTINLISEFHPFAEGKTFYHYEDFIEYMGQDEMELSHVGSSDESLSAPNEDIDEYYEYYDDNGNEISREEYERLYMTETVYDKKGNVLFTYIRRNDSVREIRYGWIPNEEGEDMPITVYDEWGLSHEDAVIEDLTNPLFFFARLAIVAGAFLLYFRRKKTV